MVIDTHQFDVYEVRDGQVRAWDARVSIQG
jgi:hypothetical protein